MAAVATHKFMLLVVILLIMYVDNLNLCSID